MWMVTQRVGSLDGVGSLIMGLPQHNGAGWEPAYDCLLSVRGTKTSGRGGATYVAVAPGRSGAMRTTARAPTYG